MINLILDQRFWLEVVEYLVSEALHTRLSVLAGFKPLYTYVNQ